MKDIIIGIDAGTSVCKSVAFSMNGEQLAESAINNTYETLPNGGVEQDPWRTWQDAVKTLVGLSDSIPNLKERVSAICVTGQGDGTWLIDDAGEPTSPGWLWLDARAGDIVDEFQQGPHRRSRFEKTGTGFAACQQSAHMMWMQKHAPELLQKSTTAFHCKDWLYLQLTGIRATDPTEACFTFGDYRTRTYSDEVIGWLGLEKEKRLLPEIIDGAKQHHGLTQAAASACGLLEGTPVVLGYVDVVCTALGAGAYHPVDDVGCTIVGSTGIHLKLVRRFEDVTLNDECSGFTLPMPIDGVYAQFQSNLASTINIDWVLDVAVDLLSELGEPRERRELIPMIDQWVAQSRPSSLLYQPYILEAGERGPIIDNTARAGFIGLNNQHRFPDLVNAVIEGLALAARDCYAVMGSVPAEIRLTGGAARSVALRRIFGNVLGARLRTSQRQEAGAAGAAMMAAVRVGAYASMDDCVEEWVTPLLDKPEEPDSTLVGSYDHVFQTYVKARKALQPVWRDMANARGVS